MGRTKSYPSSVIGEKGEHGAPQVLLLKIGRVEEETRMELVGHTYVILHHLIGFGPHTRRYYIIYIVYVKFDGADGVYTYYIIYEMKRKRRGRGRYDVCVDVLRS